MTATAAVAAASESATVETGFRPAGPRDEALINSAFLRGLRESSYTHGLPSDTFFSVGRQAWAGIQQDFQTTIAYAGDNEDEAQGFVTHGKDEQGTPCIAWLYVAKPWRRFGIGTKLLTQAGVKQREPFPVIFANPQKLAVFRSKGYQPKFVPFLSWKWLRDDVEPRTKLP